MHDDELYVVRRIDGKTRINSFPTWGPLGRKRNIEQALDESTHSVSERLLAATSMLEIALFVEDVAHQAIIGALVQRLAQDARIAVQLDWRNARHGHGKVVQEFADDLRDLRGQSDYSPDLLIVATDANCKGLNERANEFKLSDAPSDTILAIPRISSAGCCSTEPPSKPCSAKAAKHPIFDAGIAIRNA